jgi:hypothetical protein
MANDELTEAAARLYILCLVNSSRVAVVAVWHVVTGCIKAYRPLDCMHTHAITLCV